MFILLYGIGFNSRREHRANFNGKTTPAYRAWRGMLARCYCPKLQGKYPTYIGCTVDEEWHDFQDFADWFESHKYSGLGYELDKDILQVGNKLYSPNRCCLIPHEINCLLSDSGAARGEYPQGVCFFKKTGKFMSQLRINGKTKYLGSFDCPDEAHQVYKKAKEAYVKEKAFEWEDRIEGRVFQALINWELKQESQ